MKKEKYKEIEKEIKRVLEVDIYADSRKRKIVTARTLFIYMLRKDYNLTLYDILDIFKRNGKSFTHATLIHSYKLYEITKKEDKRLEEIRATILRELLMQNQIVEKVRAIEQKETLIQINNYIEELCKQ